MGSGPPDDKGDVALKLMPLQKEKYTNGAREKEKNVFDGQAANARGNYKGDTIFPAKCRAEKVEGFLFVPIKRKKKSFMSRYQSLKSLRYLPSSFEASQHTEAW